MSNRRALFLDRDGVINVEKNYLHRKEEVEFVDGIFDLVRTANAAGFLVVVVTNQAGIGRGYYSEDDFHALSAWMSEQFRNHGGRIDGIYFCPHHPEHGVGLYRRECDSRKPGPGMLLRAARELGIDLHASLMIGDRLTDMEAARAAGVPTRFLLAGNEEADLPHADDGGIRVISSLRDALMALAH